MQTERTPAAGEPEQRISSEQFTELFCETYYRLWGLATALVGDRTEAEDLVQDSAMVALQKLEQFTPGSNFTAWMARIVRMHAANWKRKKATRRTSAADPVDLDQSQPAALTRETSATLNDAMVGDTQKIQEDFDDVLLTCLHQIDELPRACLLLRVVHELAYDEIAAMLEIPTGTAMSHVHRSKKRMRDLMAAKADTRPTGRGN